MSGSELYSEQQSEIDEMVQMEIDVLKHEPRRVKSQFKPETAQKHSLKMASSKFKSPP
jgi:hypothetical protein